MLGILLIAEPSVASRTFCWTRHSHRRSNLPAWCSQLSKTPRGGHSHRHCSHSCDRGQKILTIVFVAWPLDRTANGTLTVWPHTLDYTMCNTHAKNVNILTAVNEFENCPWPLDRHQKQPLTPWLLLDPGRSRDYGAYGNDHPLNAKTALVRLAFLINAHQNANQNPIGSAPAYRAQCTVPPQPIYQTLLFNFSRV